MKTTVRYFSFFRRDPMSPAFGAKASWPSPLLQEGMRLVPVKTADQQALTVLIKTRALFIRQRTKAFNAIRSHLAEFGLIVGTGTVRLEALARSWTAIKQVASLLL
ncbi:hypothetical protein QA644_02355 [Rhizobium sp. CC1099]|uniref:hypothetical protein n=1 Tax=Rhizobium sp. CC1099 TaxID=3039160 RepID=UPI0024B1A1F2|nr:hypothetical protein [Rhizobium sp. CC1099]WFU87958.1 hypothetical protein QA644_02355 [Rhizobium sp. CC1099]